MQQQDERQRAIDPVAMRVIRRMNMLERLGTANELAMKKRMRFAGGFASLPGIYRILGQAISAKLKPFQQFSAGLEVVRVQCAGNRSMVHQSNKPA